MFSCGNVVFAFRLSLVGPRRAVDRTSEVPGIIRPGNSGQGGSTEKYVGTWLQVEKIAEEVPGRSTKWDDNSQEC